MIFGNYFSILTLCRFFGALCQLFYYFVMTPTVAAIVVIKYIFDFIFYIFKSIVFFTFFQQIFQLPRKLISGRVIRNPEFYIQIRIQKRTYSFFQIFPFCTINYYSRSYIIHIFSLIYWLSKFIIIIPYLRVYSYLLNFSSS